MIPSGAASCRAGGCRGRVGWVAACILRLTTRCFKDREAAVAAAAALIPRRRRGHGGILSDLAPEGRGLGVDEALVPVEIHSGAGISSESRG